jgi:hypothetical protein
MPLPTRNKDESAKDFMSRCMSSDVMNKEFPDNQQRVAVCTNQSRAGSEAVEKLDMASEELAYKNAEESAKLENGGEQASTDN